MDLNLRNIPQLHLDYIDALAESSECSREEFLRDFFQGEAQQNVVMQNDLKWESLFIRVTHFLDKNNLEWLQLLSMLTDDWENEIQGDDDNGTV